MTPPQTSQMGMNVAVAAILSRARETTVRDAISAGTLRATVLPDETLAIDMNDLREWMDTLPKTGGFR